MPTFKVDDWVWKTGGKGGYAGLGKVVAVFQNWMGQPRYVVGHRIADGTGWFYHIYSEKELSVTPSDGDDASPAQPPR